MRAPGSISGAVLEGLEDALVESGIASRSEPFAALGRPGKKSRRRLKRVARVRP
ncbi:MAG: hypothetical protein ABIR57_12900 [Aeromicrobium sp.]